MEIEALLQKTGTQSRAVICYVLFVVCYLVAASWLISTDVLATPLVDLQLSAAGCADSSSLK